MRRLSGLDSAFLYAESPAMPLHGGGLTILDPSTAPGRSDVDRFREVMAARLDRLVPFRQRLTTTPFGANQPAWVDGRGFDLRSRGSGSISRC
ncbi:MAG: wax ester/triacylglycerol synthase domain-containing protein [Micromonosporaceae bacterium]